MKLYHATSIDNMDSINANGLVPSITTKISNEKSRILKSGIFGFTTLKDAKNFGLDNMSYDDLVILEIDVKDNIAIDDPEYDGEAKFVEADEPMENIKLVFNGNDD